VAFSAIHSAVMQRAAHPQFHQPGQPYPDPFHQKRCRKSGIWPGRTICPTVEEPMTAYSTGRRRRHRPHASQACTACVSRRSRVVCPFKTAGRFQWSRHPPSNGHALLIASLFPQSPAVASVATPTLDPGVPIKGKLHPSPPRILGFPASRLPGSFRGAPSPSFMTPTERPVSPFSHSIHGQVPSQDMLESTPFAPVKVIPACKSFSITT
jgi:hypothetical protein